MDKNKQIAFLEKVIYKTKENELKWYRLKEYESSWLNWNADGMNSFATPISPSSEVYLLQKGDLDMVIYPGNGLSTQSFNQEIEDIDVLVHRLYNIVYAKFPNIDSVLDDFINSP